MGRIDSRQTQGSPVKDISMMCGLPRSIAAWTEPILGMGHHRYIFCALLIILFCLQISEECDGAGPEKNFNPYVSQDNPYGLDGIEEFLPGPYIHTRWGVYEDSEIDYIVGGARLNFGPWPRDVGLDLFLSRDLMNLDYANLGNLEGLMVFDTNPSDRYLCYNNPENFHLLRTLRFSSSPFTDLRGNSIRIPRKKKVIILIHGWNAGNSDNSFKDGRILGFDVLGLGYLSNNLAVAVDDPDWEVLQYHWESDAATGPVIEGLDDINDLENTFTNGIEAAEGGIQHGTHLGTILRNLDLDAVHFIAHSAGTWVARAAIDHLFECSSANVQVTLLDPFIPGKETSEEIPNSNLESELIDEIDDLTINSDGNLVLLENYYAIDLIRIDVFHVFDENFRPDGGTDHYYRATSGDFSWRLEDVNRRIDFGDRHYESHSGPIEWYGDTVDNPSQDPAGDNSNIGRGWLNSMYMQEPVIISSPPGPSSVMEEDTVTLSVMANTRAGQKLHYMDASLGFQWYKSKTPILLSENATAQSASLEIADVAAGDAGTYYVEVFNGPLRKLSGEATLTVASSGSGITYLAAPEIASVSPSPNAATEEQTITINGRGFQSGSTIFTFFDTEGTPFGSALERLRILDDTTAEYDIRVANDAGLWQVEAISDGVRVSNRFSFLVVNPSQSAGPTGVLANVTISGPKSLVEGQTESYAAEAHYTFGSPDPVMPTWSVQPSSAGSISSSGSFTAWQVFSNQTVFIVATYNGKSASFPVEIINAGAPGSATLELIRNGDFESDSSYWSLTGAIVSKGAYPYHGSRYLLLGQENNASDTAQQNFTIPANATSADLRLRLNITSDDTSEDLHDWLLIFLDHPGGSETLGFFRNRDRMGGPGKHFYNSLNFDLSSHIGETVTLRFACTTDGSIFTTFRVDQIRATAVVDTAPKLEAISISGPSIIDEGTTEHYVAKALYSDGSSSIVNASWSDNSTSARFLNSGDLKAHSISGGNKGIVIRASYSGVDATKRVTIRNTDVTPYYTLNLQARNGQITKSPDRSSYRSGTKVDLEAVPNRGYEFANWSGDASGSQENTTVTMNGNKSIAANFDVLPPGNGAILVNIHPEPVVLANAQWRVDGGAWRVTGALIPCIIEGNHQIDFKPVAGWDTPTSRTVTVNEGQTALINGTYSANGDTPFIFAIYPKSGPIDGGATVTIEGANFLAPVTVRFGNAEATSVEVVSDTILRAVTPSSESFGTVSVEVETQGGSGAIANGFTYIHSDGWNLELLGNLGGEVRAIVTEGNYAYTSEGPSLVVLDVSNKANPLPVGRLLLPEKVEDLDYHDGYLFAACSWSGLQIIDVTVPTAPRLHSFYDTEGDSVLVQRFESVVYLGDRQGDLHMIDVSVIDRPVLAGVAAGVSDEIKALDVTRTVDEKILVTAATWHDGLQIFDVTDPTSASIVGAFPITGTSYGVSAEGSIAYLADQSDVDNGIRIIDITDPTAPVQLSKFGQIGYLVDISGTTLYMVDVWARVFVIDVSDPRNPVLLGKNNTLSFGVQRMDYHDGYVYIAHRSKGMQVVDVSNPENPNIVANYQQVLGQVNDVEVAGSRAYLASNNESRFHVIDVSSPGSLTPVGALTTAHGTQAVALSGAYAYLAQQSNGVEIIDLSDPHSPRSVGYYTNSDLLVMDVSVEGSQLFAAGIDTSTYGARLDIVSISNPANPSGEGEIILPTDRAWVREVEVASSVAYLADEAGLDIVDVSNPNSPNLLGTFPTVGDNNEEVAVKGNYAYVAASDDGLLVVDVSNPANPEQVTNLGVGSRFSVVTIEGDLLYAGGSSVFNVYDVTDPGQPIIVASHTTPGVPLGVDVVGNLIFVADGSGGFSVLGLLDYTDPTVSISPPAGVAAPLTHGAVAAVASSLTTSSPTIDLDGSTDDDVTVVRVTWSNSAGGAGDATGTNSWSIPGLPLHPGLNIITITAHDEEGNTAADTIDIIYNAPSDIRLEGDLDYGTVAVGGSVERLMTIYNDGAGPLIVGSVSYPGGFSGAWTGEVPPGGSRDVVVTFTPTSSAIFSGQVTVNSDATTGTQMINVSGSGLTYDDWATSFFGSPLLPEAARDADPDGDEHNNEFEFLGDYFPNSHNDQLDIQLVASSTSADIHLSKVVPGTRYAIKTSDDAKSWYDLRVIEPSVPEFNKLITDSTIGSEKRRFYKVELLASPSLTVADYQSTQTVASQLFTVSGAAQHYNGVSEVQVSVNGGAWQVVEGAESWSADLTLVEGENQIEVRLLDGAGNLSTVTGFLVTYDPEVDPPSSEEFALIPGGDFTMGSPESELGRNADEIQHAVTVSEPFYLKKSVVTWAEWNSVRNEAAAHGYTDIGNGRNGFNGDAGESHPVTEISWWDTIKWCNLRSEIEGRMPVYHTSAALGSANILRTGFEWVSPLPPVYVDWSASGYRLPTEAEWEYACRAGTTRAFYTGAITQPDGNDPNLNPTGWYSENSGGNTHPVKQKTENAWGLYGMHGNVWEWCWDWYDSYPSSSATDPRGPTSGLYRVCRGGSFDHVAKRSRAAQRLNDWDPGTQYVYLGFRVAVIE
jgi:formylglycine-generating enzyme required for sulfatase activity